jgi:hypothetical protein
MAEPTIVCPKCHQEIKLTESLAAPLVESTRRDFEQRLAQKDLDVAGREKSIREREEVLSKAKESLETRVNELVDQERSKIATDEARKAKLALANDLSQKAKEVAELLAILKQKDEKLAESQKAQADLLKKERELDDARRELDLTVENRISDGLNATRQQVMKEAEENLRLKVSERDQVIASMQKQVGEMVRREKSIREREESLSKAKESLETQVNERVEQERLKIATDEARKAKLTLAIDLSQKAKEVSDLNEILKQKDEKLAEAQKTQVDLIKKQRELDEARRELELTVEKRVSEGLNATRQQGRKEAEDELKLKVSEKEQTIASMQKQIEDLKRSAEQGSQQLQGEVQELALETLLRARFPHDTIEPVPKGEYGGDALQRVNSPLGQSCGTILWESKRTENWSDGWLAKLRDDQRTAKAEIAIIISQALPKGVETFGLVENVWVATPQAAIPVAVTMRFTLIEIAMARQASEGQQTKMEMVYQYLTGPRFRQRVQAIVEAFSSMKEDLDKERKVIIKQWAKREEQIERVMQATVGMYGDMQGIAGKTLQEIEGLEMKVIEDAAPSKTGAN